MTDHTDRPNPTLSRIMSEFQADQSARIARGMIPYPQWIRNQCERCGIPWREEYATPLDDRQDAKQGRKWA